MQPLVSIIVPIYNVEKYIEKCFDSIRKQDVKEDIEIICIDDGSTDKSGIICDKYVELDKRFKVIHQSNKGVSYTRNLGVQISKGKYLAWIDPDDYIDDNWWNNIKKIIDKDVDIIFFDYRVLKGNQFIDKSFSNKSKFVDKHLFLKEIVIDRRIQNQLWQKVFKKSLMQNIKFPENISLMEDYAGLHKIVLNAKSVYYIAEKLYIYRIRDNSIVASGSIDKNYKAYLISKDRYVYLLDRGIKVPKIGYLIRALHVCIQYYKADRVDKNKNQKIYIECKNELKLNRKYILMYKDCNIEIKIRFLLEELNLLNLIIFLKNYFK